MALKLRLTGAYGKALKDKAEMEFTVHGGTIGRAVQNDWCLPDRGRHLSSRHAIIQFQNGHYFIVDTSTNGVFLNHSHNRIGRGNAARLHHGDQIQIADYVIDVVLQAEPAPAKNPRDMSLKEKDQMVSFSALVDNDLRAANSNLPTAAELDQRERDFADEFLTETIAPESMDERPDGWDFIDLPTEEDPGPKESVKPPVEPEIDLLSAEELGTAPSKPVARQSRPLIPENDEAALADDEELGLRSPGKAAKLSLVDEEPPRPAPARKPAAPPPSPPPAPKAAAPKPRTKTQPPPAAAPAADRSGYSGPQRGDPTLTFLQAAGLETQGISPEDAAQIMRNAGQLLREFVVGAMDTLVTRSEIKNDFRVSQTSIQSGEFNPMRFSGGVDESLRSMLLERGRRHMSPVEAVRQTFHDLRLHQIAMAEAMKDAVDMLYNRFDPAELEERFERGMKRAPLMGKSNQSKYWDLYKDLFGAMSDGRKEGLPNVFAEELARAYETRIRELTRARANQGKGSKSG